LRKFVKVLNDDLNVRIEKTSQSFLGLKKNKPVSIEDQQRTM